MKVCSICTISATNNVMALQGDRADTFENIVEILCKDGDLPLAKHHHDNTMTASLGIKLRVIS